MTKANKKIDSEQTCHQLSLERFEYLFDTYDKVAVSFSGGKDSTACLNLALEVARHKKRLPLDVFTFDEEAIPPETVEYMARVAENPEIRFQWFCVPIEHRNACSSKQTIWYPWAPEDRAKWVRDLPPLAITDFPGFRRGGIPEQIGSLFGPAVGTVANVMGVRSQESLTRLWYILIKKGFRCFLAPLAGTTNITNAYPIYDWRTEDVWRAPQAFGWDYNRAYDVMDKAGIPLPSQRCAPPYGEQPIRGLHKLKSCWPELWAKMVDRVPGAATAARYANTDLYGCGVKDSDLPEGMTWQELTIAALRKLPKGAAAEAAGAIKACLTQHRNRTKGGVMPDDEPDPLSGFCWKTLYIAAKVGGDKFGRQAQKMRNKALVERIKRNVTK